MLVELEFHSEFRTDLLNARDYYDSRELGLGDNFAAEVESGILRVAETPKIYGFVRPPGIRGAKLKRFSGYSIVYEIISESKIYVYAVFCWRRDPAELLGRLPY